MKFDYLIKKKVTNESRWVLGNSWWEMGSSSLLLILAVVQLAVVGGCGRGVHEAEVSDIEGKYPAFQAAAMYKAAKEDNREYLARQVELLGDDDAAVRFYAIMSLKKMTGTDNGYNYRYDAVRRREAIERWKEWIGQ